MIIRGINACIAGISIVFLFAMLSLTAHAAGQDAGAGKDVFAKRCSGCHAPDSEKEGPRLRGVVGRKAGTVPGFPYSDALRNSGIVWNESLLDKWLENPQAVVKDNDMEFHVANAAEREAVIAYLKSLAN
jgi:cytochrome c